MQKAAKRLNAQQQRPMRPPGDNGIRPDPTGHHYLFRISEHTHSDRESTDKKQLLNSAEREYFSDFERGERIG